MAPPAPKPKTKGGRSALADVVAREYTIHLHKRVCQSRHQLWSDLAGYGKRSWGESQELKAEGDWERREDRELKRQEY